MEDNAELEDVSPCYHISFNDGDPQEDEDAKDAPPELEEGVKTIVDSLKEVNLHTEEEPRPTYLSALLEADEERTYIELLKEFRDVFAWSYKEMPVLDLKVAVHHLAVKNGAHPIKQAQRHFRPDLVPLIETEVNILIEVGFIRKVKYPTWVSSIVPLRKKNGQIRVCVDFRDLNNACPKDEFPLPIPELMIDVTTGYEAMSFMDGSSGYNQIRMAPKDEELTAFRTPTGIYCYKNKSHQVRDVKPVLSDRLARWYLQFQQFEIMYIPQQAIKGQALANFLADHPILDDWELTDELPDEDAMVIEVQPPWKMYFEGAAHRGEAGAGVVFVTSQGEVPPYSFLLTQLCSNNVAEYQSLILGLEMAVKMKRLQLQVFGNSQLVVNQLLGSYEVKKPELCPYHYYAKKLMGWLSDVTIQYVPRKQNKKADALAALASSLTLPDQAQVTVCQKWVAPLPNEAEVVALKEVKKENVASFIRVNIIYHFGIPHYIITDDGKPFDNRLMNRICELFGFKQRNSSMYNTAANGLVETFNNTLCNLLKKVISKSKRDWDDRMEEALWAYRTTHNTPTQAIPLFTHLWSRSRLAT
ncbi:uncharacterized protein [Nicotiana sylvestris]|uniref:uncharacterized protein n=1 Tax=Nicotiana sylvestris TaxID=4096 RepID=UPI00388C96AE